MVETLFIHELSAIDLKLLIISSGPEPIRSRAGG